MVGQKGIQMKETNQTAIYIFTEDFKRAALVIVCQFQDGVQNRNINMPRSFLVRGKHPNSVFGQKISSTNGGNSVAGEVESLKTELKLINSQV